MPAAHRLALLTCLALCLVACQGSSDSAQKQSAAPLVADTRGAQLYRNICAVCHGQKGEGYKADEAPALAQRDFLASVTDDFLRTAIRDGRTGSTMSAWALQHGGPLSPADVEELIHFIRTWDKGPKAKLDERPLSGDAGRGAAIFLRECSRCHGLHGIEGPNIRLGNRDLLATATNGYLRYAVRNGRPGTKMQRFDALLGDQGIEDVVAALRAYQTGTPNPAQAATPPAAVVPPPLPLGPVPLNPGGPEPEGFHKFPPGTTPVDIVHAQLARGARMALLDARAPSDYANQHIAGAVSVPYYDPSPYLQKLPKNAWLVCYCACPHAESGELAGKLVAAGFSKVTVLDEGLGVWNGKGYPVHTGTKP